MDDVTGFLRASAPPFVRVVDVRIDAPAPDTSLANQRRVFNTKFALAPIEDLLGSASQEDAHAYQVVADELAHMERWHDAYQQSSYARLYSGIEWQAPAPPPVGQTLLVILHKKDVPTPPIYGKLAAEWQVDHWRFFAVDLDIPEMGTPQSGFQTPNIVVGSPEAEAFLGNR